MANWLCGPAGYQFQSTPPARGATQAGRPEDIVHRISIHAPREGGDVIFLVNPQDYLQFQSTPPARGATAKMHSFTCESLTNK